MFEKLKILEMIRMINEEINFKLHGDSFCLNYWNKWINKNEFNEGVGFSKLIK